MLNKINFALILCIFVFLLIFYSKYCSDLEKIYDIFLNYNETFRLTDERFDLNKEEISILFENQKLLIKNEI